MEGKGQSWGQPEGGANCHRALGVRSAGPALVGRCGQTAYLQACQNLQQPKREPRIFGYTSPPHPRRAESLPELNAGLLESIMGVPGPACVEQRRGRTADSWAF